MNQTLRRGKLVWQGRATVRVLKTSQIKATSEQLMNCKLTINFVVSIAICNLSERENQLDSFTNCYIATVWFAITSSRTRFGR